MPDIFPEPIILNQIPLAYLRLDFFRACSINSSKNLRPEGLGQQDAVTQACDRRRELSRVPYSARVRTHELETVCIHLTTYIVWRLLLN